MAKSLVGELAPGPALLAADKLAVQSVDSAPKATYCLPSGRFEWSARVRLMLLSRMTRALLLPILLILSAANVSAGSPTNQETPGDERTPLTAEEALRVDARAYADSFGVSVDEGLKRAMVISQIDATAEILESRAPGRFAGGWFEHTPTFRAVLRFKGSAPLSPSLAALIPESPGVSVEMGATNTLVELLAGQAKVYRQVWVHGRLAAARASRRNAASPLPI